MKGAMAGKSGKAGLEYELPTLLGDINITILNPIARITNNEELRVTQFTCTCHYDWTVRSVAHLFLVIKFRICCGGPASNKKRSFDLSENWRICIFQSRLERWSAPT